VVEFASGVKHGHDDFKRWLARLSVNLDGNASTVVFHRDRIIRVQRDIDLSAEPGERFVYRIVDDFEDEAV
jgi:hypothetical protein